LEKSDNVFTLQGLTHLECDVKKVKITKLYEIKSVKCGGGDITFDVTGNKKAKELLMTSRTELLDGFAVLEHAIKMIQDT